MNKPSLGENLKQLRISEGIGQTTIAKALNVSVKTVSHWETNYTEPSVAQLIQLAEFFNVTLDELVGKAERRLN